MFPAQQGRERASPRRSKLTFVLPAAAGLGLCALSAAIVLSTPEPGDRPLIALAYTLMIALPVGVGLWARYTRPDARFGRLLVAAGFLWFIPTLATSENEVVYSTGRVGTWLVQPLLVVVILAFPSGRLQTRLDRGLVVGAWALVVLCYLPTALVVDQYPVPNPYAPCRLDCPDNAFMLTDTEPAFIDAWLVPARDLVAALIFFVTVVVLAQRFAGASHLMRRTLAPVLTVAVVLGSVFVLGTLVRRQAPESLAYTVLSWIYVLCIPGIAVAFVVGLLRWRLFAGGALQRQAVRLRGHPDPDELTAVLRETMEDPSLELVYWIPGQSGRWVDAAGTAVSPPAEESERSLTKVRDGDRLVAGLIHDAALRDQQEFVEAATSLALASLENQRLAAKVDASLQELQESRARLQSAADSERQRIERDLHDGAQQRLVALRIRLGLAGELVREDPTRSAQLLGELGTEAEEALEEVRALAHGVYPSLLTDLGLVEALRARARDASPVTIIDARGLSRYPPEVESAVYFCCLEALQNASKHAQSASSVSISLTDDGVLSFEIRDDGAGFSEAAATAGAGFTNMHDRLAAVGGELTIGSEPGVGTRVAGTVPLG